MRTCRIMDFTVPVDHRVKIKENEKADKYLDLVTELKNLENIKVTSIPIVIIALGTIPKGLVKRLEKLEIGGRSGTIQITALFRSSRIMRRVQET